MHKWVCTIRGSQFALVRLGCFKISREQAENGKVEAHENASPAAAAWVQRGQRNNYRTLSAQ